ncbi:MAG: nitrilase-related carbon-nitrogen hydrolase, partial [Marinicellaceae bacterium]
METQYYLINMFNSKLNIGMAQMAAVWLDKKNTLEKIETYIEKAAANKCQLVVFSESLLPGYPFWLS